MQLAGINLHPVKSTAIRPVSQARVSFTGLVGDREWMLVDDDRHAVTAREFPRTFLVTADTPATGLAGGADLRLSAEGHEPIEVVRPTSGRLDCVMFDRPALPARPAPEADAWLSAVLGRDDLHLVWCGPEGLRQLSDRYDAPDTYAVYQDSSPVSVVTTASVDQLNSWTETAMPVTRFRANLLIDGAGSAFEEDDWKRLTVGDAVFRGAGPIDRCNMPLVDPETLAKGKDPIRTLAKHRKWDGATWFAAHLVVEHEGDIHVGDDVLLD